jgi:Na+/proline symporter
MSDIGGIFTPTDLALIALMICGPGLALGGAIGALVWRRRRVVGGLVGAVAGFAPWLLGWLWFSDVL